MSEEVRRELAEPVEQPATASSKSHLYYLDWLRVVIIGMVFVGHVTLPFSGVPWLITSDAHIPLGGLILAIGNQFAMPVMFLIAGASSFFSLRKRAPGRFARERLLRLGLPYIVFTLLLSPVQAYYAALDNGSYSGRFFPDFLPHFFNLDGFGSRDLSFLGHYGYHLWFLGFLLFFSLVSLPLIGYLKRQNGQRPACKRGGAPQRPLANIHAFRPVAACYDMDLARLPKLGQHDLLGSVFRPRLPVLFKSPLPCRPSA
jgi:hypothetical protein